MSLVKVWNDNDLDFSQVFKDVRITIPAKGYIEMDWEEANAFKSYPHALAFNGMGQQLKSSYKMIRVEPRPDTADHVVMFRCHKDGSLHASKDALAKYEADFGAEVHADVDVAAAKRAKTPKTASA
jgi:hypothetical protein